MTREIPKNTFCQGKTLVNWRLLSRISQVAVTVFDDTRPFAYNATKYDYWIREMLLVIHNTISKKIKRPKCYFKWHNDKSHPTTGHHLYKTLLHEMKQFLPCIFFILLLLIRLLFFPFFCHLSQITTFLR